MFNEYKQQRTSQILQQKFSKNYLNINKCNDDKISSTKNANLLFNFSDMPLPDVEVPKLVVGPVVVDPADTVVPKK